MAGDGARYRVGLIVQPDELPAVVRRLLHRVGEDQAAAVWREDLVDVRIPLAADLVGAYLVRRRRAAGALRGWPPAGQGGMAPFASAHAENLKRHVAGARRRPSAAARLGRQCVGAITRRAVAVLAEADALAAAEDA